MTYKILQVVEGDRMGGQVGSSYELATIRTDNEAEARTLYEHYCQKYAYVSSWSYVELHAVLETQRK